MKEDYKNIRAIIVLSAAFITWLLNMKYNRNLVDSLIILLAVIIAFLIIANIAIKLFDKIKNMKTNNEVKVEIHDETAAAAEGENNKSGS